MSKENTEISERIKLLIESLGSNRNSFAKALGYDRSQAIYDLINGKAKPSFDFFSRLLSSEYSDTVNVDWIITGSGSMLKSKVKPKDIYTIIPAHSVAHEPAPSYANDNIISIPIVDVSAAAGHGFFNSDHPEALGELKFPASMVKRHTGNYYCGRVNGESMAPTLLNQDFIIFRLLTFDEWEYLKDDNVYFIVDRAGTSYVKRIKNKFHEDGTILCLSDNVDKANFRDFPVNGEDIANIYHVEWRFSKDMSNVNETFFSRMSNFEDRLNCLERSLLDKRKGNIE